MQLANAYANANADLQRSQRLPNKQATKASKPPKQKQYDIDEDQKPKGTSTS